MKRWNDTVAQSRQRAKGVVGIDMNMRTGLWNLSRMVSFHRFLYHYACLLTMMDSNNLDINQRTWGVTALPLLLQRNRIGRGTSRVLDRLRFVFFGKDLSVLTLKFQNCMLQDIPCHAVPCHAIAQYRACSFPPFLSAPTLTHHSYQLHKTVHPFTHPSIHSIVAGARGIYR